MAYGSMKATIDLASYRPERKSVTEQWTRFTRRTTKKEGRKERSIMEHMIVYIMNIECI